MSFSAYIHFTIHVFNLGFMKNNFSNVLYVTKMFWDKKSLIMLIDIF